jgi:zinc protease
LKLVLTLAALALLAAVFPTGAAETARKGVFPYPIHTRTLANGLSVVVIPMPSNGLVAFWSVVRTGSRDEFEPGHTGFAHFFEHMMFRGTERFPSAVYNAQVTKMGASANAFTSDDLTAYHLAIAAEDLPRVMDLESDRFRNLRYAEDAFKTEAGAVYGEYRKNRTSPFFAIYEAIRAAAFTKHTYGHTTMGYEADIAAMPSMYAYSKEFFARYYRPENVTLVVTGDVKPEAVFELAQRYYGEWQRGYQTPVIPEEPEQTEERRIEVAYQGRTLPILWAAYKLPRFDVSDRKWAATEVLGELAFGETSALYKKLVLDEQVLQSLSGGPNINRDPNLFDVIAQVKDPAKIDAVLVEIDATIAGFAATPADAARLAATQQRLKYGFLMSLASPSGVASNLARLVAVTGDVRAVDRLYETYTAVTPADVQAAARDFLKPGRRTIAVLEGNQ